MSIDVKHSKDWWYGRFTEAELAAGSGASEFDQTKLSTTSSVAYLRSWSTDMFPMQVKNKEAIESNDDGVYGGEIVTSGWSPIEGNREEYIQDTFYWDLVLAYLSLQGDNPGTYTIHQQDHLRAGTSADTLRMESYGCFVKALNFVSPVNNGDIESFPYWKINDACYSTKYDDGTGTDVDSLTKQAYLSISSYPIITKASATIGGLNIRGIEFELAINCIFDETKEQGDDGVKYPYFINYEIEFTVRFRNYTAFKTFAANLLENTGSDAYYTVNIDTGLTDTHIQITNMIPKPNGNLNKIPGPGMVDYEMKFINTGSSVLSEETA